MSKQSEKKFYQMLTDFANDHTLAKDIKVVVHPGYTSLTAKNYEEGARYEDSTFLASLISGAQSFLFWCERHGYEVKKRAKRS